MKKFWIVISVCWLWTCGGGGGSPTEPKIELPSVQNIEFNLEEDTSKTFAFMGSDPLNRALTYSVSTQPQHGTLTINAGVGIYTPYANYYGADTFAYIATNVDGTSNIGTIVATVTPVDDEPNSMDVTVTTDEDNAIVITLEAEEVDGDKIVFQVRNNPSNGSLTISGTTATYTPNQDWNGTDTFNFEAVDSSEKTILNVATATIIVNPVNDAPVAHDVTASTQSRMKNMSQTVTITLDATDIEGDNLTYRLVSDASNGSTSLSGYILTYSPFVNYDGTDTFTYKANDGESDSNIASVTIDIENVNLPPESESASYTIPNNWGSYIELLAEDDDGCCTRIIEEEPSNGLIINLDASSGQISDEYAKYEPGNYHGEDYFKYKVFDGVQYSQISTISLNIINALFINVFEEHEIIPKKILTINNKYYLNDLLNGIARLIFISEDFQNIQTFNQQSDLGASTPLSESNIDFYDEKIFISGKAGDLNPKKAGYQEYDSNLNLVSERYFSLHDSDGDPLLFNTINHSDGGKALIGLHGGDNGVQRFYAIKLSSNLNIEIKKEWINTGDNEFNGLGQLNIPFQNYRIRQTTDNGYIISVGERVIKTDSNFNISWFTNRGGELKKLRNGDFGILSNDQFFIYNHEGQKDVFTVNLPIFGDYSNPTDFEELPNGDLVFTYLYMADGNYVTGKFPTFTIKRFTPSGSKVWEKSYKFFEKKSLAFSLFSQGVDITTSLDGNLIAIFEQNIAKFDASNGELFSLD